MVTEGEGSEQCWDESKRGDVKRWGGGGVGHNLHYTSYMYTHPSTRVHLGKNRP